MQYCGKCKIRIRGDKAQCPLCQGQLTGEAESPAFPVLPKKGSTRMSVLRVSLFVFIAFEVAMGILWFMMSDQPGWVILAMCVAAIGILDIALTLYYRSNPLHIVVWEIYIAMGVTLIVDSAYGFQRWSVNWVFPVTFIGLMITTAAIGKGMKLKTDAYIMYLFFHLIMSAGIQLFLLLTHLTTVQLPAVISIAFCIVFFAGMVIFNRRVFRGEAKKFFNV